MNVPLLELTIKNIALIDSLTIEWGPGLSVITGETGAGKSIIVGAIQFLLGGKSGRDLLRTGTERGSVSLVYDARELDKVAAALDELGLSTVLDENDGLLVLSRELHATGRTICKVAGEALPLNIYRKVTDRLIELHGQHGHHALLSEASHCAFLDELGDARHMDNLARLKAAHGDMRRKQHELAMLVSGARERARLIDIYAFQLKELRDAKIVEGEETRLEAESRKARHQERIDTALRRAYSLVAGTERSAGAMNNLRQAAAHMSSIATLDERYAGLSAKLEGAAFELEDTVRELEAAREEATIDQRAIDMIESRLELLSKLGRKYGATTGEMLAHMANIEKELANTVNAEERAGELEAAAAQCESEYLRMAEAVSKERHAAADVFSREMVAQLRDLSMSAARFDVSIDSVPEDADSWTESGFDKVSFLFSANKGEPLKPLSQVASGGELSRVMLSLKTIEANKTGVPVLIFDEIDAGISGRAAQAVAEKLDAIARYTQVLCVTHLPQIAAMADNPYCVSKSSAGGKTLTSLRRLDGDTHIQEIARLISGADEGGGFAYAAELRRTAIVQKSARP